MTSCFGLGWLPICPGTFGSLPPVVVFALMCYFKVSALLISMVMIVLALAGSFVCLKFSPVIIAATGKIDPPEVVADEFAGQAVTFLVFLLLYHGLPAREYTVKMAVLQNWQLLTIIVLGFVLFRLFDIIKPWPINALQKLPQGWGILADDLMAGVYAGIVLLIFTLYVYPLLPWSQEIRL